MVQIPRRIPKRRDSRGGAEMDPEKLLQALHVAARLKDVTRHCYTPGGRHESVAEHSWRLALMAYLVRDAFPDADMDRVIRMCLIHDLGEAFTGDIPSFLKTQTDEDTETRLLHVWVETLPEPYRADMLALYREMDERKTTEARIYKALDGLEAIISHNESDLGTWTDNEFDLNLTYADDKVAFSDYLTELRACVRRDTEEKIAKR